jgi:hypothetical protein
MRHNQIISTFPFLVQKNVFKSLSKLDSIVTLKGVHISPKIFLFEITVFKHVLKRPYTTTVFKHEFVYSRDQTCTYMKKYHQK